MIFENSIIFKKLVRSDSKGKIMLQKILLKVFHDTRLIISFQVLKS